MFSCIDCGFSGYIIVLLLCSFCVGVFIDFLAVFVL